MEDIFLTGKRHKAYPQLSSFPCTEGKEQQQKSSLRPGTCHSTGTVPCPELVVMENVSSGLSTRWFTLQLDYLQIQMQLRICDLNIVPFQDDLISVNNVHFL